MWDLLKKNEEECGRFRNELEVSTQAATGAETADSLLAMMRVVERGHAGDCGECRTALEDFLKVRALMQKISRSAEESGNPWFAERVMGAIAAREAELIGPAGTWIALPKLASRLALAACAVLVVGSTWLYQRPRSAAGNQAAASAGPDYLFETPAAPMTQDDVLVSLAENNR